jgi:hypothetical protein
MLGNIFYLFGLLIFVFSFSRLINYNKILQIQDWVLAFKKVAQKDPTKKDFRSQEDYNLFLGYGTISVVESIWIIFGLLSGNWQIFLILLLSGVILKNVLEYSPKTLKKVVGFTFSFIRTITTLILVLNHFHFHLNIFEWITQITF